MEEVDSDDFEKTVLQNSKPVVVDFWAEWCMPCLRIAPIFERVSKKFTQAVFVKLNVDKSPKIASQYGVMSIPTLKVFKNGEVVGEVIGAVSEDELVEKLEVMLK